MKVEISLEEEQKTLVLARFKTLNPESKIMLGGEGELTVKDLINHIESGDDFGRKIIQANIKMLKVLSSGA